MKFEIDDDKEAFDAYCENMQYIQRLTLNDMGFISLIRDGWIVSKYPRVIDKLPEESINLIIFDKKTLSIKVVKHTGEITYGDITKTIVDNSANEVIAIATTAKTYGYAYIKAVFGVAVSVGAKEVQILGKGEAIIDLHNYLSTIPTLAGESLAKLSAF